MIDVTLTEYLRAYLLSASHLVYSFAFFTIFLGTSEIFYPDVTKFYSMLEEDPSNELIIGDEMCHVYPLFPIDEAKPAVEKIINVIKR